MYLYASGSLYFDRIPIIPGSGLPNDIDVDFPGKSCSAEQGFFAGGRIHFP
jgi:hypothetical protein